jgi:hypothetical protein
METAPRHQCMIYEGSPAQHLKPLAAVIRERLEDNYRCVYMNSASMVAGIQDVLNELGVDVAACIKDGSLVVSSEPVVSKNGDFDIKKMIGQLEAVVDQAVKDGYKGLFATGDMTWEFGSRENYAKLVEYEWQLEKLFRRCPQLTGICQYHNDTLSREIMRQGLMTHRSVYINETLSYLNTHYIEPDTPIEQAPTKADLDAGLVNLFIGKPLIPT